MTDDRPQPSQPLADDHEQPAGPAQVPGAGNGGSRRMMLVALAVCLCVLVAGVSVAVFSSSGGQTGHIAVASTGPAAAKTRAGQSAAPTAPSRVTTGPEVRSGEIAKSALRWPPRLKHQILRWKAGPGGAALATVDKQLGTAEQAAGAGLYATMRLACVRLTSGIKTAQAGPPIPDDAMQRLYVKALAGLSSAVADCRHAISAPEGDEGTETHVNKVLLNRSRVEFAAMSKKLYRATAEIQARRR